MITRTLMAVGLAALCLTSPVQAQDLEPAQTEEQAYTIMCTGTDEGTYTIDPANERVVRISGETGYFSVDPYYWGEDTVMLSELWGGYSSTTYVDLETLIVYNTQSSCWGTTTSTVGSCTIVEFVPVEA